MSINVCVPNMRKTDSICACVAYASLEKHLERNNCFPVITQPLNPQALMLFEKFNVPIPRQTVSVQPRAHHIQADKQLISINENEPIARALEIYTIYKHHALPCVDNNNKVIGVLTYRALFDLFLSIRDESVFANVLTNTNLLYRTIKAVRRNKCVQNDELKNYAVVTLSGETRLTREALERRGAFERTVYITAPDGEICQFLANNNAAIVIVCRPTPPEDATQAADEKIVEYKSKLKRQSSYSQLKMDESKTIFMETDLTVTLTTYLVKQATPIKKYIERDRSIVGQMATLHDVKQKMQQSGLTAFAVADKDGYLAGMITRSDLLQERVLNVNLVGCGLDSAPDGVTLPGVFIKKIISSNAMRDVETTYPIEFVVRPLGCTSTIVHQLYQESGVVPSISTAGLLLGGIVANTKNLAVATQADINAVKHLETICGFTHDEISTLMLEGAAVAASPEEIVKTIQTDVKQYKIKGGDAVSVAQTEVLDFSAFETQESIDRIVEQLKKVKAIFSALLITDVVAAKSILIYHCSKKELLKDVHFARFMDLNNCYALGDIISRKKQLMPYLLALWTGN